MTFLKSPVSNARQPAAGLLPLLLACALLLAQTLGLMHGVLHGTQMAAVGKPGIQVQAFVAAGDSPAGWLAAIFSAHQGDNDCRLFDQASQGSAAPQVVVSAPPVVMPSSAVALFQGAALARFAALFDARGPPLTLQTPASA
jgi:hypothetical protein